MFEAVLPTLDIHATMYCLKLERLCVEFFEQWVDSIVDQGSLLVRRGTTWTIRNVTTVARDPRSRQSPSKAPVLATHLSVDDAPVAHEVDPDSHGNVLRRLSTRTCGRARDAALADDSLLGGVRAPLPVTTVVYEPHWVRMQARAPHNVTRSKSSKHVPCIVGTARSRYGRRLRFMPSWHREPFHRPSSP